jgi:hypothetical protein
MPTKLTARQQDKLIEAAQNAITFTVQGRGQFPTDMLRYDLCWPASGNDSHAIEITYGQGWTAPYSVTLKGLKLPTTGRWESFGWKVVASNG